MTRTPHDNLLVDLALDCLEELLAKRASIPREKITVAVVKAAIIIANTAADVPLAKAETKATVLAKAYVDAQDGPPTFSGWIHSGCDTCGKRFDAHIGDERFCYAVGAAETKENKRE